MKIITVVIPTYNEELNIRNSYERVRKVFVDKLPKYDFQILFIDNDSKDDTRGVIRALCDEDPRVQAIFNNTNFGFSKSSFYGLTQYAGSSGSYS